MQNLNKYIEHTLLKQDASEKDLIKLFDEAKENDFLGVCVNPCYVKIAKEHLENTNVKIVTVIGFPLGANTTEVKVFETRQAIADGADEIDMVINGTKLKDNDKDFIVNEVKAIKQACNGHNLKVIIETDLLNTDEIVRAAKSNDYDAIMFKNVSDMKGRYTKKFNMEKAFQPSTNIVITKPEQMKSVDGIFWKDLPIVEEFKCFNY